MRFGAFANVLGDEKGIFLVELRGIMLFYVGEVVEGCAINNWRLLKIQNLLFGNSSSNIF